MNYVRNKLYFILIDFNASFQSFFEVKMSVYFYIQSHMIGALYSG